MVSPRINATWIADSVHTFTISWGYYFQPPYYSELRNKADVTKDILKAQRAIHYAAGWEYRFKKKVKLNVEAYYKDLSNLIPYYIDREKTEYYNKNSAEGFAYGFEAMVQGEVVEGLNSWLGYNYLNTQERNVNGGEYHRRLTDNNHSIQVFLQDKIKKHPNWQAHFRLLFNTGYVFSMRRVVTDDVTGKKYIQVYYDKVGDYPAMYMRADMGLSASFDLKGYKLVAVAEVMNMFNHRNFGSYRFTQVSSDTPTLFAIPQVLSSRFFNLGVELKF
jgi:outer membrane receptor for ferrienterochelin and colicin